MALKIISRSEAKNLGLKRYYTGKPCKRGHISERWVGGDCIICSRENTRKSHKKNIHKRRDYAKKYRKENNEAYKKFRRKKYKNNPEPQKARSIKNYYKDLEASRKKQRQRYKKNPEAYKLSARNRKARIKNSEGSHTLEDVKKIKKQQKHKCVYYNTCIKYNFHIDHIYPLAMGGSNYPENLQILCPACNLSKGAKDPIKFSQENGFLL